MIKQWLKLFWQPAQPNPLAPCLFCGSAVRRSAMAFHVIDAHKPRPSRVYELLAAWEHERGFALEHEPRRTGYAFPN